MSRKQPPLVRLTRRAVDVFWDIVDDLELSDDAILRLTVEHRAGGSSYRIRVNEVCEVDDVVFRTKGVTVAVSEEDADFLEGATIDYKGRFSRGTGFIVDNPNESVDTNASDPGMVRLSRRKLREFHPELAGNHITVGQEEQIIAIQKQLLYGDSRAAVVMSVLPLLVAAYTDELDCIAMLRFPAEWGGDYKLNKGTKLLTVNYYSKEQEGTDLTHGPNDHKRWTNFSPMIADFLSDDEVRILFRKRSIRTDEWDRCKRLGKEFLRRHGLVGRDGSPLECWRPAF